MAVAASRLGRFVASRRLRADARSYTLSRLRRWSVGRIDGAIRLINPLAPKVNTGTLSGMGPTVYPPANTGHLSTFSERLT